MDGFSVLDLLNLQSALLGVVVFLVLYRFLRRPRNLPPGPRGWPLLGNLPQLVMSGVPMHEAISKMTARYGDVILVKFPGASMVVLHGHKTINEAFGQHQLSARATFHITEMVNPNSAGIAFSSGPMWVETRRFAMTVLRGLGVGKSSFEQNISTEAECLVEELNGYKGSAFDPKHIVGNAVSNVICSVVLGKRFNYSDPDFKRLLKVLSDNAESSGLGGLFELSPLFVKLKMFPSVKRFTSAVENLYKEIAQLIGVHEQDVENPRDLIDVFYREMKIKKQQGVESLALQPENLRRIVAELFGAGSETTTTTLRWGMLYIMAYPEIQARVQQELDQATSRNRLPRISDKPDLPYTEAVLCEIHRMGSIVPLALPHMSSEDTTVRGYYIPKGSLVMSNLWHNHYDPSVWDEPDKFRPERFLDKDGKFQPRDELVPFGIRRRVCLGEHLAKMELFIFFSHLLHHFTIKKPQDTPPITFEGVDAIMHGPVNFKMCAIPRE